MLDCREKQEKDEFFSLPLFPQSSCALEQMESASGNGTATSATGGCYSCGPVNPVRPGRLSQCSNCGTTCVSNNNLCPRCGATMTNLN